MNESTTHPISTEKEPSGIKQEENGSYSTQLEILRLINESLRTDLLARENRITFILKENESLKKENILLKRNFKKFTKSLFLVLQKTGIDNSILLSLKASIGQIFDENAFSSLSEINPAALENPKPDSWKTEEDSWKTETDTWKTENDSLRTENDIRRTQIDIPRTQNDTMRTQNDTMRMQIDTMRTQLDLSRMQIDARRTLIDISKTQNDSLKTQNDSLRTLEDQSKTTIPGFTADSVQSITDDEFPDMDLFQMILETVMHKNIKHKRYIENGISKPLGSKREIEKAQLIEKSIHSFCNLPGCNELKNKLISIRMIFSLRQEFLNKFQFITSYITMSKILLYIYLKGKITPKCLLNDLGYSRSTCYKMYKLFRTKQWLESYGLKDSDAFYLSEKGRQFVESVIAGINYSCNQ